MVPPNWEHPKSERGDYLQPMFDKSYAEARALWLEGLAAHKPEEHDGADFWEWEGMPPDREYYRPWADQEATWYQLWETVSEGTPVTPPYATKEELADYLAEHGDAWDQNRGDGPWGKERAQAFIRSGLAPSGMSVGGRFFDSRDVALELEKDKS